MHLGSAVCLFAGGAGPACGRAGAGRAPSWAEQDVTFLPPILFLAIGLAFDPAMLSWPAGPKPEDGVCNKHGQTHEVANLFISDGSQFTTGAAENPTLTIIAMAMRQAEHIGQQMKARVI